MIYAFGPLQVQVESLGKQMPPWNKWHEEWAYHLVITDSHGHSFEGGWFSDTRDPQPKFVAAQLVGLLWTAVDDPGFVHEFGGGYQGEEAGWRRKEAYRLRDAGRGFDQHELTKAAAIAGRQKEYEQDKGPRDWSPKGEFPRGHEEEE
jgi:hypothetical protein